MRETPSTLATSVGTGLSREDIARAQPPTPSWGLMVSEGKGMMFFKAWVIAIPGTALFMLMLCINLLGDGIRDVTAPENRN